jgi:hypothetical protein
LAWKGGLKGSRLQKAVLTFLPQRFAPGVVQTDDDVLGAVAADRPLQDRDKQGAALSQRLRLKSL